MNKVIIVGGGTAGIIAAAYAKANYGEKVQVTLIYDHLNPNIGVGESLTPSIQMFLRDMDIKQEELIRNTNALVKTGLKFKNWLNDGTSFYHGFAYLDILEDKMNNRAAYEIAFGKYDLDTMFSNYSFENNLIPDFNIEKDAATSFHIDANLFSKFIEEKFKKRLKIIDDKVIDVIIDEEKNIIKEIVLEKNGKINADIYIDASGFARVLIKRLKNKWIDKTDWLPINKFIAQPIPTVHTTYEPYTTAEASDHGWILKVPIQHRWGTGYLYSSEFTTDDEALSEFSKWTKNNFNKSLNVGKILTFKSGYWEDQWVGNCVATGLASGFAEPLEATNILHTILQMNEFFGTFNYKIYETDRVKYNSKQRIMYKNIYEYIRFCYTNKRDDTGFWNYMANNIPQEVKYLNEKIENDYVNYFDLYGNVFTYLNFTCVGFGLKKPNKDKIKKILCDRGLLQKAKDEAYELRRIKTERNKNLVIHKKYIEDVLTNKI